MCTVSCTYITGTDIEGLGTEIDPPSPTGSITVHEKRMHRSDCVVSRSNVAIPSDPLSKGHPLCKTRSTLLLDYFNLRGHLTSLQRTKWLCPKVSSSCAWIIGSLVPRPSDTECGEQESLAKYEASPCIGLIHLPSNKNADSLFSIGHVVLQHR